MHGKYICSFKAIHPKMKQKTYNNYVYKIFDVQWIIVVMLGIFKLGFEDIFEQSFRENFHYKVENKDSIISALSKI